ncbi:MAG: SsrA-binding protein SmpB [Acidobacteriota bacterium]
MTAPADKARTKVVTSNRKAFHEYFILERFEAGLALTGTEVKSLRDGSVQLKDSYAEVRHGEAYLVGCHISPYKHGNRANHLAERDRKLLLHKREIRKLAASVSEKGLTLVPLSVYFKGPRAKIEVGIGRGKKFYDKRESIKKRDLMREAARER